jgi:type I restriction enzyme S subunit
LNEKKYFLINRGEITDRLDPLYYVISLKKLYKETKYKIVKLRDVIKFAQTGFSAGGEDQNLSEDNGIIQIRPTNMTSDGTLVFHRNVYLKDEIAKRKTKLLLTQGEVLFNNTNSQELVGKTAYFNLNEPFLCSNHITRIKVDTTKIEPKYLWIILNTLQRLKIFYSTCTNWNNQSGVNVSQLSKYTIPLPKIDKQKYIISVFETGIEIKTNKEKQVNARLAEIDEYILKQLDVYLPKQSENTIGNRIFKTGWQKVTGNRLDPKKYSYQSESLIACIENSKFRKVPLKSLVVHSVAGDWGLDEKEAVNQKLFTKCLVIRATEFDNNYNLNIENSRAKFRLISNTKLKKLDIKPQDFLLEKSGGSPDQPVGRISILENELLENNTIAYSNFIHKFRVNTDEVLPEFLFCFLKTIHNIKLTDVMQSQTNGIRNLIMREYWNQSIILPDKKKQKEIADTIYQMRAEAKQTEIDAQKGFEQTKKEIEKLILE